MSVVCGERWVEGKDVWGKGVYLKGWGFVEVQYVGNFGIYCFFFLRVQQPPISTLFPCNDAHPILRNRWFWAFSSAKLGYWVK